MILGWKTLEGLALRLENEGRRSLEPPKLLTARFNFETIPRPPLIGSAISPTTPYSWDLMGCHDEFARDLQWLEAGMKFSNSLISV